MFPSDYNEDGNKDISDVRILINWNQLNEEHLKWEGTPLESFFPPPSIVTTQARFDLFFSNGLWETAATVAHLPSPADTDFNQDGEVDITDVRIFINWEQLQGEFLKWEGTPLEPFFPEPTAATTQVRYDLFFGNGLWEISATVAELPGFVLSSSSVSSLMLESSSLILSSSSFIPTPAGAALLTEGGGFFLTEGGDFMVQEGP